MVVDGDDWVVFAFSHSADHVGNPLLHLGIGALDRVELDGVGEFSGI